ncbi:MAG: FAD-dependent oxidoreductase [Proteobacteria bacterium]|nr:MAG: FAD-dependent oxidoreductase [Pseudomonadota bacterium]
MKIAIVGGGISGNVVARELSRDHEIVLFEANDYLGGHTHTHRVEIEGREIAVDTGFIVFNDWTYPNFNALIDELGVASQPSDMSFSVCCEKSGLQYNGTSLNGLFCQRRNLARPRFYRMLADILRFNRHAPALLEAGSEEVPLGEFLSAGKYGREVIDHYIVPMGAAIWSTQPAQMLDFPARFFVRFLNNHGLLNINRRPCWRVIKGGSRTYLDAMSKHYRDSVLLDSSVASVNRLPGQVQVRTENGDARMFDHVFLACHSDQALAMLDNPSDAERDVLGALPYQRNEAVLHTDVRLMPANRRAWAAWNYLVPNSPSDSVGVTYNMNILQRLDCSEELLVTLNHTDAIDPSRIIRTMIYDHPLFTVGGTRAQARYREINGVNNTWYCGAYWRNGFHEDGVVSAMTAVDQFRKRHETEKLHLRRAG